MKHVTFHEYSYFSIYRVRATENTLFKWLLADDDVDSVAAATYYKGTLKVVEAFNPQLVGQMWRGHYDWSDRATCPDFWYKKNEWQHCMAFGSDIEWWCLHAHGEVPLRVNYLPVTSPRRVELDTSVVVLEGNLVVQDDSNRLMAGEMTHVKPRSRAMTIEGDAKVWLIRRN